MRNSLIHHVKNDAAGVAGIGINLFGSGQGTNGVLVESNTVHHAARMGIFIGGRQASAPYNFLISSNNLIRGNTVYQAWQGPASDGGAAIQIMGAKNSRIEENTVHDTGLNWYGIYVGGAVAGSNRVASNQVYNNQAGIAIWTNVTFVDYGAETPGAPGVSFNSLHDNPSLGVYVADTDPAYRLNAENNWWGCNAGPGLVAARLILAARLYVPVFELPKNISLAARAGCDAMSGNVDADPWLVLRISAAPTAILPGAASTLTADLTYNSVGADTLTLGHIPDGTSVLFETDFGTVGSSSVTKTTTNGQATATLTAPAGLGTAHVSATVHHQTVATTVTVASADMRIVKTGTVLASRQITFLLRVTNGGPLVANGVVVTDTLPAGVTYSSARTSKGSCSYNATTRVVTCTIGRMGVGLGVSVVITVRAATGINTVTNTGQVQASTPDPNPANNSSTVTVRIP